MIFLTSWFLFHLLCVTPFTFVYRLTPFNFLYCVLRPTSTLTDISFNIGWEPRRGEREERAKTGMSVQAIDKFARGVLSQRSDESLGKWCERRNASSGSRRPSASGLINISKMPNMRSGGWNCELHLEWMLTFGAKPRRFLHGSLEPKHQALGNLSIEMSEKWSENLYWLSNQWSADPMWSWWMETAGHRSPIEKKELNRKSKHKQILKNELELHTCRLPPDIIIGAMKNEFKGSVKAFGTLYYTWTIIAQEIQVWELDKF